MASNVVIAAPTGTTVVRWGNTPTPADPPTLVLSIATTGTTNVPASGTITNTGTTDANWTLTSSPAAVITGGGGVIAPGASRTFTITVDLAGAYVLTLTNDSGGTVSGSPVTFTASDPVSSSPFTVVESGVSYATLAEAIAAASSGNTITGIPGTYHYSRVTITKSLTIKSTVAGSRVVIDAEPLGFISSGQYILGLNPGLSLTLEDIELTGNKYQYDYCAGLATLGACSSITLRRCKISECSNGILGSNADDTSDWLLEDCEFLDCGTDDGLRHNIYLGHNATTTMRGCWSHMTRTKDDYVALYGAGNEWRESFGHLVKVRSKVFTAVGNRFTMETQSLTGGANRCIDYPNGGELYAYGNLLQYKTGQNNGKGQAISWGVEGVIALPGLTFDGRLFKVSICQNTIVGDSNYVDADTNRYPIWIGVGAVNGAPYDDVPAPTLYEVKDNVFAGWIANPPQVLEGPYPPSISTTYAVSNTTNTVGALSILTNSSTLDFTPVTPVTGSQNWAAYEYVHQAQHTTRTDATRGAISSDYGAMQTAADALSAGSWVNWTSSTNVVAITDTSGPGGSAVAWLEGDNTGKVFTNWPGNWTWDAPRKRVIGVGCTNGYSSESPAGAHSAMVVLDVTTGDFSKTWNPYSVNIGHQYDCNSSVPLGDYIYRASFADTSIRRMDLQTGTWTTVVDHASAPISISSGQCNALAVHPNMGASGSVLMFGPGGRVGRWDVASSTASLLSTSKTGVGGAGSESGVAEYHPGIDAVVFGGGQGGTRLYTIDSAGTIALLTSTFPAGVTEISPRDVISTTLAPDPQGRAYAWLFDAIQSNKVWRLNLTTGAWTDMGSIPAGIVGNTCYATVSQLGVHVAFDSYGRVNPSTADARVYLFKPS